MPASRPIRLGILGNGGQVSNFYYPYLKRRMQDEGDVEVVFLSGYLPEDEPKSARFIEDGIPCHQDWRSLVRQGAVDAVLVSTANACHGEAIRYALENGAAVAVDKPTTTSASECGELVALAESKDLVFVTLSQRRYEDLYQTVRNVIVEDRIGAPVLINYLMAHDSWSGAGSRNWFHDPAMSGGGALMSSGYHGIDTILWLLGPDLKVLSVSCTCVFKSLGRCELDVVSSARIRFRYGDEAGIFNAVASYENPRGSLDENIKIFGQRGTIRIMRDVPKRVDQKAAQLSYQDVTGAYTEYCTTNWSGQRWAPLGDFLDAIASQKKGQPWAVLSPARDSILVIRIIEAAYRSARLGGQEVSLEDS